MWKERIAGGLARLSVAIERGSSNITLLVLTRIGPGFSGSEMSGWRVDSCTLTCVAESEVDIALPLTLVVIVSVAMILE